MYVRSASLGRWVTGINLVAAGGVLILAFGGCTFLIAEMSSATAA